MTVMQISTDTPNSAVSSLLLIIQDEAAALNAVFEIEEHDKRTISEEIQVLVKCGARKFRIRLNWVRDDSLSRGGIGVGNGYIETEWELRLKSAGTSIVPPQPPFYWHLFARGEESPTSSPGNILDGSLLRSLMREKLVSSETRSN